jgi:hypothetical protein
VFCVCCVLYIVAAVLMPNLDSHTPLSTPARIALFVLGIGTLAFALSLTCYFLEIWRRWKISVLGTGYRIWVAFETLVGVPFAVLCYCFAILSIGVALLK